MIQYNVHRDNLEKARPSFGRGGASGRRKRRRHRRQSLSRPPLADRQRSLCGPARRKTEHNQRRVLIGVVRALLRVVSHPRARRRRAEPHLRPAQVLTITPGKRSPTVSPLDADGWCAVSALVLKKELSEIMDQLQEAGATDILAFDIANSRM